MTVSESAAQPDEEPAGGHSPSAGVSAAEPPIVFAGIGDEAGSSLRMQLEAVGELGWTSIELRTVDGTPVAELGASAFGRLVDTLQSRGIGVAAVASRIGSWSRPITSSFAADLAELETLAHRSAILGTRYVRVMSYPNEGLDPEEWRRRVLQRMRQLTAEAEQAGLVLVHENCSGWAGRDGDRMLTLLEEVDSPALQLVFDTGNGIAHDYDARSLLEQVVDHVAHVHVKDAAGTPSDPVYLPPGEGRAGVAACLRLLLDHGYDGAWSIEPHVVLRPHEDAEGAGPDGDRRRGFLASGRALEWLVRQDVLPHCPTWTMTATGLVRGPQG